MAYKPLLNLKNRSIVEQAIQALDFFNINPNDTYEISNIKFTKGMLLKDLKKQGVKPDDLPKILETTEAEIPELEPILPQTNTPQKDLTSNIDQRDLSNFRQNQIKQIDAILKKSTIASIQAKKAFGNKVSASTSKEIDALSWKIVALNPQINPNELAFNLLKELEIRTANLVPKESKKTQETQKTIEQNIQNSSAPEPNVHEDLSYDQKTSLWVSQVAEKIQKDTPSLSKAQAIKAAEEVRQAIQATSTTVNPQNIKAKDLQVHISKSIDFASQTKDFKSGEKTTSIKSPLSSTMVKNIEPGLLKIALFEESQFVLKEISPDLLPSYPLNTSHTSIVLNKIHTFSQRPQDFRDFIRETNARYQFINQTQTLPRYINSPRTMLRRVFSQVFGKSSVTASPNQTFNIIRNLPITKPSIPFIPGGAKIPKKLSSPIKGAGSSLKQLLGKGLGGLRSLLSKGGLGAARGTTKLLTKLLSSKVLLSTGGMVVAAVLLIFLVLFVIQFDIQSTRIFPNVTSTKMGGGMTQTGAQYLNLTKTVDQKKLENNTQTSLNYTYEISPVKDPVTITSITDEVIIYSESGQKRIDLTNKVPKTEDDTFTSPTFSFPVNNNYNDSVVSNTITVNFTTSTGVEESVFAVATTLIGDPTLAGCPRVWPTDSGFEIVQGPRGSYSHSAIEAIDINVPLNSNIYAVQSGVVKFAGWYTRWPIYGKSIIIESVLEDGTEYQHWYNHLNVILVSVGEKVSPGQVIAKSGNTANGVSGGTPAHLHFEYRNGSGLVSFPYSQCPLPGVDPSRLQGCSSASSCNAKVP